MGDVVIPQDGPVSGRHPDGSEFVPPTADDLKARSRPEMLADRFGYPAEVGDQEWAKFVAGQAHEHTYLTGATPGAYTFNPAELDIVGANGRRLIVRWVPEGVYVGGCLITDPAAAEKLAEWITRESEDD